MLTFWLEWWGLWLLEPLDIYLGEGIERDSKVLGVKNAPRRARFSTAKNKVLAFFTRWICLLGIGNIYDVPHV